MEFEIKMPLKPEICCGPYEKSLLKHLLFDYEQQSRYKKFALKSTEQKFKKKYGIKKNYKKED